MVRVRGWIMLSVKVLVKIEAQGNKNTAEVRQQQENIASLSCTSTSAAESLTLSWSGTAGMSQPLQSCCPRRWDNSSHPINL